MEYLTKEDYKIAEANGIKRKTAYVRVHRYGWSVQRAITETSQVITPEREKWRDIAIKNGIPKATFHARVLKGMELEEAATKEVINYNTRKKRVKYQLTEEDKEIAEMNGVSLDLVHRRLTRDGWDKRRALTEEPRKPKGSWTKYVEMAEANGVNRHTFFNRIRRGWEPEIAATKEAHKRRDKNNSV